MPWWISCDRISDPHLSLTRTHSYRVILSFADYHTGVLQRLVAIATPELTKTTQLRQQAPLCTLKKIWLGGRGGKPFKTQ